ncbi:MAG TPA: trypsin-like peptidase domain-containing protein [Pirellulaceae bacterium]
MLRAVLFGVLFTVSTFANELELLEFTAPHCEGCRRMEPLVAKLQAEGLPIHPINLAVHPELGARFQIQSIPCFVLVEGGREIERHVGLLQENELRTMLDRGLHAHGSGPTVRGQSRVDGEDPQAWPGTSNQPPLAPWNQAAESLGDSERTAAPSPIGAPPDHAIQDALRSTVRIKIVDKKGQSLGSGTIVDVHDEEALVLTCGHIFRDSEGQGQIVCDLFVDGSSRDLPGKLIGYDLRRDVGFLSIRPRVPVQAVRVGGDGHFVRDGDAVFAVGCSRGEDPTVIENKVLAVNRYHGPANLVVGGRPVDGRSGGGLFDRSGVLIGVCNAADQESDEGLYAALGPIHAELEEAGLSFVFRRELPPIASRPTNNQSNVGALGRIPGPVANLPPAAPSSVGLSQPASPLSSQVILILRDQSHPESPGQVFVLDQPSPETLGALSQDLARRGPHVPTGMNVPVESDRLAPARLR